MANVSGRALLSDVDLYTSNTVPSGAYVGQRVVGNGKEFVYVQAGSTALVVANLLQAPAISTQFDDMVVPTAVAAGFNAPDQGVVVTNGTVTVTASQFMGATITTSGGDEYTVIDNSAATSGSALTLFLDRPIRTAWTTSTTVTLRNIYGGVIQAPTTLTGVIVGVAINAIAANAFGWIQTAGEAAVISDNSTGAVGSALSNSAATAGDVGVFVAGTGRGFVGHVTRALSSGKYISAKLQID